MRYLVIIEKSETGYGAYAPDVPGCGVAGATVEEVQQLIQEALAFHLEGLREEGLPIPQPSMAFMSYVDVADIAA
jgi:predicted RNase H-like HicB family nuclease